MLPVMEQRGDAMARRVVVLVAASPGGLAFARELLGDELELVAAHSLEAALRRLAQGGIDLVLAGLHFDDSRMPALVEAVKHDPSTRAVPIVCCRFLPTLLRPAALRATRQVCETLGAEGFIDVFALAQRRGQATAARYLRGIVLRALSRCECGALRCA
jgi:response regulator RpfG family c-di-GMP phosphodiesterase